MFWKFLDLLLREEDLQSRPQTLDLQTQHRPVSIRQNRSRSGTSSPPPVDQAHLQLPPQTTFAAAHTVHDPGDVLEVEAELLLKHTRRESSAGPPAGSKRPGRLELTFSVLASIVCPANMDFSSKCMGNALKIKAESTSGEDQSTSGEDQSREHEQSCWFHQEPS